MQMERAHFESNAGSNRDSLSDGVVLFKTPTMKRTCRAEEIVSPSLFKDFKEQISFNREESPSLPLFGTGPGKRLSDVEDEPELNKVDFSEDPSPVAHLAEEIEDPLLQRV